MKGTKGKIYAGSAGAALVGTLFMLSMLSGCGAEDGRNTLRTEKVVVDGSEVTCVYLYGGGVDCDWP